MNNLQSYDKILKDIDYYANLMFQNELFDKYLLILKEWNKKINLVQESTLDYYFNRHIKDSLQITEFIDLNDNVIDIGSGAGFPGVPLSIYGYSKILLCEKSFKKCTFLKYLKEKLNLNYSIFNGDVFNLNIPEEILPETVAVSRAFGSLLILIDFLNKKGILKGVFHKGENYMDEIMEAKRSFEFDFRVKPSITNSKSAILIIENIRRK